MYSYEDRVRAVELYVKLGKRTGPTNQPPLFPRQMFPRSPGPFIRRARHSTGYERELVVGQWALIPWFAKEPKLKFLTNNARSEELAEKASYRDPWKRGQRCIIPAASFDEPNWETGKNIWWQFSRADGVPWGLAGLWNAWTDKDTGEVHESYTMLTLNADHHPLMRRMHKPDPKFGPDAQDKRSVIPIEAGDVDLWLAGTVAEAQQLLRLAPVEVFVAGPIDASD
jgi:putative SOS response-associated peptidase YedK